MKTKHTVIVEKTSTGYSAYVNDIDGIITVGDSLDEIKLNINEALELYCEELEMKKDFKLEFKLSIEAFFDLFESINISKFAKKVQINPSLLRQYSKGIKHPSIKQAKKIEMAIRELGENLISVNL